ncbi:hypothetical protein FOI67_01600 [Geobacillus sp. LEMMJ02]|nr:hypothetical protein FOI67_01600 [Geobacillus sp. LEMMJ02]
MTKPCKKKQRRRAGTAPPCFSLSSRAEKTPHFHVLGGDGLVDSLLWGGCFQQSLTSKLKRRWESVQFENFYQTGEKGENDDP